MLGPGARVAGYEVVRLVGLGAMCHVYEACAVDPGRSGVAERPTRVALKVLQATWCSDAEIVARFENEVHVLRTVQHRHVVRLIDSGALRGGAPYLVLEWLPRSLAHALAGEGRPLGARTANRLALHIALALGALHARGIVHRDLKAANVLLDRHEVTEAEARLADPGLAKVGAGGPLALVAPGEVSTGASALLGTWDYMAPEQWIQSKTAGFASDVYSLGVLLLQMLTGSLPFVAERPSDLMQLHLFEKPPLDLLGEETPRELRRLVGEMLAKAPSSRPRTGETSSRLLAIAKELGDPTIDAGA